jgi:DNA-directed RNA polymerase subunit RPC12/RpoP
MEGHCSKCNAQVESLWKFCPHCGAASTHEALKDAPEPHQKSSLPGAFGGLLFGVVAAPILIIPGTLLCLTGLGAILGAPMIVAGIFAPLLGPMVGLGALRGKCPWCGAAVNSIANKRDFACHACGQSIAIQHREFVKQPAPGHGPIA